MIISKDAEKHLKNSTLMMTTFNKPGIEGKFLNLIKSIYSKPIANSIVNGKRLNTSP